MFWLLLILFAILCLLIYLVFAPIRIELNSLNDFYGARFGNIGSARITIVESSLILVIRIAGWEKRIDLFEKRAKTVKTEKAPKKKKERSFNINKIRNVIKSFRVEKFILKIDTGNMQLNGMLFPLFAWFRAISRREISINFLDQNVLVLRLENNIARLIWAYFK